MTGNDLRQKFIDFFISKGHKEIPPASLVPVDDSTTLFTSSGMQPLVPYLLGQPHPQGKRLTDSQPSFRAEDIEEVGDNRHTTFFEMLGNWSLGDYFKTEQLSWFFEFLTKIAGINPNKLYVTVFDGDKNYKILLNNKHQTLGPDVESINIWRRLLKTGPAKAGKDGFNPKIKIYTYPADKNWWSRAGTPDKMPTGEIGGPDSEVFYDFGAELKIHENSPYKNQTCHVNCDCGRFLEIGNSVFMQYKKIADGLLEPLPNKNVDFGGGLERILAAKLDTPDVFKTDLFWPIIQEIEKTCDKKYAGHEKEMRVIADHLKAACFMISEGIEPSNKLQGYILRRLLRRAAVKMHSLGGGLTPVPGFTSICYQIIKTYNESGMYFQKQTEIRNKLKSILDQELNKFGKSLDRGLKQIKKCNLKKVDARLAFDLFQTYGFPFEITQELLAQKGCPINQKEFEKEFEKHQQKSRTASKGMFKGGLADHSEIITKLHTATHLLHTSLRKILGDHVQQVGSNITAERLRFDFTHPQPLTDKEIKQVEDLINQQVKQNLQISCQTMSLAEAQKQGALAFFGQKYPDQVKVYSIPDFSLEVCAGPHVCFTGKLGRFKIKKEESCSAGKRRIYGVLV